MIDEDDNEKVIYLTTENDDDVNLNDAVLGAQRVTSNDLDTIQAAIIAANPRPIRLKRLLRARRESPLEFLRKFFIGDGEGWNDTRNTIYADEAGGIQTEAGRRRSMGDIFMIMRYYYPTITLREVARLLYADLFATGNTGMRSSNCSQIHKRVWYYEDGDGRFMEAGQRDEYGNNRQFYLNNTR